jgi:hypothetical protein
MSNAGFLEVVIADDGEVVLRRADTSPGVSGPLVTIRFSDEVRALLGAHLGEVARTMIGAGMQMASQLQGGRIQVVEDDEPHSVH